MDEENLVEQSEGNGVSMVWRSVVALVALVIIAVLAYPFISGSDNSLEVEKSAELAIPVDVQGAVAEPLSKAQANPNSAKDQFELGNALYEARAWDQAVIAYQRTIEIDPNYQAAYANLGAVYYQKLQFDLAASQYEKALELNPEDGESAYNLGAIYIQQALPPGGLPDADLLDRAINQIQKALEISPTLAEPHFSLGVAYMATNRTDEATEAFETFLTLNKGQNPQAEKEAMRHLESLKNQ